jgi:hypothetical protein
MHRIAGAKLSGTGARRIASVADHAARGGTAPAPPPLAPGPGRQQVRPA